MANIETGSSTPGLANVDANYDLMVTTPQVNSRYAGQAGTPNYVGAIRTFYERDSGALTGTAVLLSPQVSAFDQKLQVGLSTNHFDYVFNATAQDTSMWYYAFTTMTMTEPSGGYLLINANSTNTASTGAYLQSKRYFPLQINAGLEYEVVQAFATAVLAHEFYLFGFGIPTTTAAPGDGVWFQWSSSGLIGVMNYNGTVTNTATLPLGGSALTPTVATMESYKITLNDRQVEFWYNNQYLGNLPVPAAQGTPFQSMALPAFFLFYNDSTGATGTAMQVKVNSMQVDLLDTATNKPYPHIAATKGLMGYQGVNGGTMGSTAYYGNNLAVGSGSALSNTATLVTGLGGQCTYQPTLTSANDGILCSYQVPVGGVNQIPRSLIITGIRIQSIVSSTLTSGPVLAAYSLAYGHTAVSMATAEGATFTTATTKAPRRIALGMEAFSSGASTGAVSNIYFPVQMQFISPISVNPGEWVAVVVKNIGTVTAGGTITTLVTFDCYWE